MQTILDGIMGSVLWKIAVRSLVIITVISAWIGIITYLSLHIYWK